MTNFLINFFPVTRHTSPMGGCRSTPPFFSAELRHAACPGDYFRCPPLGGGPGVGAVRSRGPGAPPLPAVAPGFGGRWPPRRASARVAPPPSPRGRLRLSGARPCGAGVSVLKVAPWVTWTRLQTRQLTPSATLYGYRGLVRSLRSL